MSFRCLRIRLLIAEETMVTEYYRGSSGRDYFEQRARLRSEFVQRQRARLFADIVTANDVVLDFGCGTGGVLAALEATERFGVEVSEHALNEAHNNLDEVFTSTTDIESEAIDCVISYHALEHVERPSETLRELYRVCKPGGRARIVVPSEMPVLLAEHRRWRAGDPTMHLFSWTPLTLGNLMSVAGFDVVEAKLLPASKVHRFSSILGNSEKLRSTLDYAKALWRGQFHVCVSARK